jgi:hypothetical protein
MAVAPALLLVAATSAAAVVELLTPLDQQVVYCGFDGATPRFSWATPLVNATANAPDLTIEISASADFTTSYRDAVPAMLSRYVRAEPLPFPPNATSATWYWRVGMLSMWSAPRTFTATVPAKRATVASDSDWDTIQGAFLCR